MANSNEKASNPKFAVLQVWIDGDGEVVDVRDAAGRTLTDKHYHADTLKVKKGGMVGNAHLASNPCRWRLIGGVWMCV